MDEKTTRQERIDAKLRLAGWEPNDPSQVSEEHFADLSDGGRVAEPRAHYGRRKELADYALLADGRPAAVLEAKRTSRDPRAGREQARQYAENLHDLLPRAPRPLIFYSNGERHFFWDEQYRPPASIVGFPTREELDWMVRNREDRRPLAVELIRQDIIDRPYQIAAVRSILEGLEGRSDEARRRHKFLLVMATGTGKTRTAIALADMLLRARVNPVFAKPVLSKVKLWQMIGRGTRLLPRDPAERMPWCPEKDKFLILDCWGNLDYHQLEAKEYDPGIQMPLAVRLFRARLAALEAAWDTGHSDLAEQIKNDLQRDLSELPDNNVVVAEARSDLAQVEDPSYWEDLRPADLDFLRRVIAPVLRARHGVAAKALRFERQMVELGTAVLRERPDEIEALGLDLQSQVEELPLSVNVVAREEDLVRAARRPEWWKDLKPEHALSKLRGAQERLTPLMHLRRGRPEGMVMLDLDDVLRVKDPIEFGPERKTMALGAYRQKVEQYIRDLVRENPVLQRLQEGEEISEVEIRELAELLERQDLQITEERLRRVYQHKTARFIQLLRHILDVETLPSWEVTVQRAFEELIARHNTWTALQIRFLQALKSFVLERGRVLREDLIAEPFTRIHPRGVRGVFGDEELAEILTAVEHLGQDPANPEAGQQPA